MAQCPSRNQHQEGNATMSDGQSSSVLDRSTRDSSDPLRLSKAAVIVNADDWGREPTTTGRSLACLTRGAISSVSAMVFMEDSERAADLARQHQVDAGLHLNFTLAYSASHCALRLREHQEKLSRFLTAHKFAPMVYHPGLASSFEYVVKMQLEEYERLYGAPANRVDGHHHMHLCANVTRQELIPSGITVRRNLSFAPGEKGFLNRLYRRRQDRQLARRHRLTAFFFDLQPLEPRQRFTEILGLAPRFDVEIETHPVRDEEFSFLIDGALLRSASDIGVSRGYALRFCNSASAAADTTLPQQA
jgi:hypothetical protein